MYPEFNYSEWIANVTIFFIDIISITYDIFYILIYYKIFYIEPQNNGKKYNAFFYILKCSFFWDIGLKK